MSTVDARRPRAEPGLFVVWSAAQPAEPKILEAIGDEFQIRRVLRVRWSPERVDENFARFYRSQTAPPYSHMFSDQKGRGVFTVVIAIDPAPRYELCTTTKGLAVVNANMLEAKERFRDWTGGGMRVHGTDTAREAVRDSLLLLGETPASLIAGAPEAWDGQIDVVERDVTGALGWPSLRDVFAVLNHSVDYIVLRNFEELPDEFELGEHADVDLLTDDYGELIRLLHARPMLGRMPRWGGRFLVGVDGRDVIFDLRFVGDRYYDPVWARGLLARRRLVRSAFYAPSEQDYFESLAYHAVVHKRDVAEDYRDRLAALAADLRQPGWDRHGLDHPGRTAALVRAIVRQNGYAYVVPRDPTVFFNYANAGTRLPTLRRKLAGVRRETILRVAPVRAPVAEAIGVARRAVIAQLPWLRVFKRRIRHALDRERVPEADQTR